LRNTVENNLKLWNQEYRWTKDGDEWDGQARFCRQPYEAWKRSLIETFLTPNVTKDSVVLEIAPGHGRWSKEMIHCKKLTLVDLSPTCIEFCKGLFASSSHVTYLINDGKSLTGVPDESIDFLWSYDSFVHMDKDTIASYLREAQRVLKPGGKAIIHHAGRRNAFLWLRFIRHAKRPGEVLYKLISMGKLIDGDGWRSDVSRELFHQLATESGLQVESQVQSWGQNREFGIPRFGDYMTTLRKNSVSSRTHAVKSGEALRVP
jgi:ubiquinone/menaquinone biosynthesis C-methylase UbiE